MRAMRKYLAAPLAALMLLLAACASADDEKGHILSLIHI